MKNHEKHQVSHSCYDRVVKLRYFNSLMPVGNKKVAHT